MRKFYALSILLVLVTSLNFAEEVIWKGQVSSDGTPSQPVNLEIGKKYQIIVSGSINNGKWVQGGKPLADDAGFEYNSPSGETHLHLLRNSSDIKIDTKIFQKDHVYKSAPFTAQQDKLHFWVHDTDYSDNSGAFDVQIIQLD